jgi:hypothetical protein
LIDNTNNIGKVYIYAPIVTTSITTSVDKTSPHTHRVATKEMRVQRTYMRGRGRERGSEIIDRKPSNQTDNKISENPELPITTQNDENSSELPIYQAPAGDLFMSWGQVGMLSSECITMEVTYEKSAKSVKPEIPNKVNKTDSKSNTVTSELSNTRKLGEYYTDLYTTRSGNRKAKESYGSSVAFIGDTILVGAELGVGSGNYTGVVYIDHDVLQYLSLSEYDRLNAGDKSAAAYTIIEKITEFSNSAVGIAMIVILPAIALAAMAFHRSSSRIDQHTLFSSNVSPDAQYTHPSSNSSAKAKAALAECFPLKDGKSNSKSNIRGAGDRDRDRERESSSGVRDRLRGKRVRVRLYDIEGSAVQEEEEDGEEEGEGDGGGEGFVEGDIEKISHSRSHSNSAPAPPAVENSQNSNLLDRINGYFVPAKLSFTSILAVTRGYMKGQQTDAEEGGDRDGDRDGDSSLGAVTAVQEREKGREKSGMFPTEAFSDVRSILHNDNNDGNDDSADNNNRIDNNNNNNDNDAEKAHESSAAGKLNSSIILREREREGTEGARERERERGRRREREDKESEEEGGGKGEKKLLLRI